MMNINHNSHAHFVIRTIRELVAIFCICSLLPGDILATQTKEPAPSTEQSAPKLPADQLDALVAPIALYPDPLLSQALVASTYPLEIVQLQQWLDAHKTLKDKALTDAVMKQDWDPSVQAMAVVPDMVKRLSGDIKWTTDLGNAFLAQQGDVMDAVQRMRSKAQKNGALKSSEQQKVETQTVENKQVIVIQPASTEVIYVPSYNPTVVYGPPVYPYPPVYYPPPPPPPPPGAYVATAAIAFGVGMMVGAAWHGGYGWGCGWGHNDVNINVNNNFNRNTTIQGGTRVNAQGGNTWQHNPQHRGGAPYSNQATANKYGGTARGDSMQTRQANARQNQARQQSAGDRDTSNRGNSNAGNRGSSPSAGTREAANRGSGGNQVGNQRVPSNTPSSTNRNAFGGSGSGTSGSQARASSSRGASSYGGGSGSSGGGRFSGGGRRK